MPRRTTPLTDVQARNAKPTKDKDDKLFDGGGLYLLVTKSGSKGWRLKYRFNGKEGLMSLGIYPSVSLSEARGLLCFADKELRNTILSLPSAGGDLQH